MTGSERRAKLLDRVKSYVCQDRQNAHGDAEDNFIDIAKRWTLHLARRGLLVPGKEIDPRDVGLMQIDLKVARASANLGHQDNYDDIAGYAACSGGINELLHEPPPPSAGAIVPFPTRNGYAKVWPTPGFNGA